MTQPAITSDLPPRAHLSTMSLEAWRVTNMAQEGLKGWSSSSYDDGDDENDDDDDNSNDDEDDVDNNDDDSCLAHCLYLMFCVH
jgi:hypothetical protein